MPDPHLTLVLGGARSGKSAQAEGLVTAHPAPWLYLATAETLDAEMRARVDQHRASRATGWVTLEAPLDLADALLGTPRGQPVLIDCLTLWLTNILLSGRDIDAETDRLTTALANPHGPWVVVANETGLGIVPDNALARAFRDAAGRLNQRVAAVAGRVLFIVAGLPMQVK